VPCELFHSPDENMIILSFFSKPVGSVFTVNHEGICALSSKQMWIRLLIVTRFFRRLPHRTFFMRATSSIEHNLLTSIIDGVAADENTFNSLAISVFKYQHDQNPVYRRYCDSLGHNPSNFAHWHDIPAVPTDVFKLEDYPVVTFSIENTHKTFLTSGTTTEVKGQHHFPSLELYENSIKSGWDELNLPHPSQAIFLTASPQQAPQSSLSHMMGVLADSYAENSTWAIDASGKIDLERINFAIQKNEPVALLGTALAFLHLFNQLDSPISLPAGSWAMETGGYKGTSRHLEKEELYHLFEQKLNLAPDSVVNEYSMTELSSQFYTRGLGHPHTGPSWTRVRVIDPLTETDALPGEPGHLVIYDLANLHSVMAIRTQDIAVRSEADLAEGNNSFTLLGRDLSALPRGCSRAADHSLRS